MEGSNNPIIRIDDSRNAITLNAPMTALDLPAAALAISNYIRSSEILLAKTDTSYLGAFTDIFNYFDPLEIARAYESLLQSYQQSAFLQKIILYALLTEIEPDLNAAIASALGNVSQDTQKDVIKSQTDLRSAIELELAQYGKDFHELSNKVIRPIRTYAKNGLRASASQYAEVKQYFTQLFDAATSSAMPKNF